MCVTHDEKARGTADLFRRRREITSAIMAVAVAVATAICHEARIASFTRRRCKHLL